MLSKHIRTASRLITQFAQASNVAAVAAPKYDVVKFVKEDVADVMKEVPDVQYYYFGGNAAANPYQSVPIDEPVLVCALFIFLHNFPLA